MSNPATIRLRNMSLPDVVYVEVRTDPQTPAVRLYFPLSEAWLAQEDLPEFLEWLSGALKRQELVAGVAPNEPGVTFYDPGPTMPGGSDGKSTGG